MKQVEAKLFGNKEMTPANNSNPQEEKKKPRNAKYKSSHKNLYEYVIPLVTSLIFSKTIKLYKVIIKMYCVFVTYVACITNITPQKGRENRAHKGEMFLCFTGIK